MIDCGSDEIRTILRLASEIIARSFESNLEIKSYRTTPEALRELFKLEREHPGLDIVLVRSDEPECVRKAFKNYFSDATDFISLIESGYKKLTSG